MVRSAPACLPSAVCVNSKRTGVGRHIRRHNVPCERHGEDARRGGRWLRVRGGWRHWIGRESAGRVQAECAEYSRAVSAVI